MEILNVINKEMAHELIAAGYKCHERSIGDQQVFSFIAEDDLLKHIGSQFEVGKHYFMDCHMRF